MRAKRDEVAAAIERVGGRLEWRTRWGVGISLPAGAGDEVLRAAQPAIRAAAWINLEGTRVGDAGIVALACAPRLEAVRLVGSKVSLAGIERFLAEMPSLVQVDLGVGQLEPREFERLRDSWPRVEFAVGG